MKRKIGIFKTLAAIGIAVLGLVGNATAQTASNPLNYIYEGFAASGIPASWTYNGFSWQSSGGVENSAYIRANIYEYYETASVTTSNVAAGANPVLSFRYKATNWSGGDAAPANALQYTVFISTDDGTNWTALNGFTDVRNVSSADFATITVNSSSLNTYRNQTIRARITFEWLMGDINVNLDDVAVGTVPPIFSGATTLVAGTVYNNYSSPLNINTRTYSISNKGSQSLNISNISTTGGVTVTGLSGTLSAFQTKTITVSINAFNFANYAAYNGSFTFNTNDPGMPTVTVNVTGTVRTAPEGDSQNFAASNIAGWTFAGFSWQSSGGVENSACVRVNIFGSNPTASVTTSNVAVGANPVLSFRYKATNWSGGDAAPANALQYTVFISTDDGTNWTALNGFTDVRNVSSADFATITANLPTSYANQIIRARIIFEQLMGDINVNLDDVSMESGYTITFNANGGSVSPAYGTTPVGGGTVSLPNPTRNGYTHNGWFTATTGGTAVTTNTVFSANTTIYARWTPTPYNITYDLDGGINNAQNPATYNIESSTITLYNPNKSDYTFDGWYSNASFTGTRITSIPTGSWGAQKYYAKWVHSVIFDLNGGLGTTPANIIVTPNGTLSATQKPSTVGFTRAGHINDGKWYTRTGTTEANYVYTEFVFGTTAVVANTTLYLKWTPGYIVSFDLNGGSGTIPADIIITDVENSTLNEEQKPSTTGFTRNGYVNDGKWYTRTGTTEANYVYTEFVFGTSGTAVTEHIKLYLKWIPLYTVSFNLNGGTGTMPASITSIVEGSILSEEQKPPIAGFTRSGYVNDGKWYTRTGITEANYVYTEFVFGTSGTAVMTNITLYLKWTPTYTVGFNLNNGTGTAPTNITDVVEGSILSEGQEPSAGEFTRSGYVNDGKWYTRTGTTEANYVYTEFVFGTSGAAVVTNTTLYLKWIPISYEIVYDLDGGTVSPSNPVNYTIETPDFTLNNPSKDGYAFAGWTGSNGTIQQTTVTIAQGSAGNKSYTANWMPITYAITYNLNSGTVSMENPTSYTIETPDFTLNNPTRDGYTFAGWTGSNGTTRQTAVSIAQESTGNKNYTANWTLDTYTIIYDLGGGTVSQANPTSYNITTSNFTLRNPTKTGYTFVGWSGANGTIPETPVSITQGSSGDREYTANWTPIAYTITYNLNSGTISPENPTSYTIETPDFTLNNPTRDGYTFAGWIGSNGTTRQTAVSIAQGSTGNKNYTANWTSVTYTITYDLDGGVVSPANSVNYTITTSTFTLRNPTKTGYTFAGWTGTNGTTPQTTVSIAQGSTADKNYTANWTPITYTITYNLGGGTVSPENPASYTIETPDFTLNNPAKTGYTFAGWTGANGTTPQTAVTIAQGSNGNKSYTANWTFTYMVIFIDHDGTVLSQQMVNHGSAATAPTSPTRTGYDFTGWDTDFSTVTGDLTVTAVYVTPILPKIATGNLLTQTRSGINLTAKTNATIAVYNLNGKLISRQNYLAGNHSISFGHLPKGMYIVKASFGSEKQVLRVPVR